MVVRNEAVRLSLIDDFTSGMARATAETALFKKELNSLDGRKVSKDLDGTAKSIDQIGNSSRRNAPAIDRFGGRLRLIAEAAVVLGPALIPIGATIVPALTASLAGLTSAAGALGVTVLAFNGLGDAMKALQDAQLEPTIENLQALHVEMEKLGPAGAEFAHFLDSLEPKLRGLQNVARSGLFPGLEEGIKSLVNGLPGLRRVVADIAVGLGDLAAQAGKTLAGPKFTAFFDYLETDARPTLEQFAHTMGNLALGVANMLAAFAPLTRDFTGGLESMTRAFAAWSDGLDQNQSFQDFLNYIRETGPEVKDFFGALIAALADLVKAAAPFGEFVLNTLTGLLNVLSGLADTSVGPGLFAAAAGMVALSRGVKILGPAITSLNTGFLDLRTSPDKAATAVKRFGGVAKAAAGAAGMGLFITSLSETNRSLAAFEGAAGGALAGFSVGGPWGAAIGGAIGLVVGLGQAHEDSAAQVADFTATLDEQTGALTENSRQKAINLLNEDNALGAAKALGLSVELVTDAATGNTQAMATLNEQLDKYINADLSKDTTGGTMLAQASTAIALRDALARVVSIVTDSDAAWNLNAEAMGNGTQHANELRSAYDRVTDAAAGLQAELTNLDNFLNRRGSFRAVQDSLDALRASLKDAPHAFSAMGEAGRTNLGNLDQILSDTAAHLETLNDPHKKAAFLNTIIANLKEIGTTSPEAAAAVADILPALQKVRDANKAIVIKADNAEAMKKITITREAAHDLATSNNRIPITADTSSADAAIARLAAYQFATKVIKITSSLQFAAGGTVPGPREPYGDKVLIHAAPGEEIISNSRGQADRFRADRAMGRIPSYADGGSVADNTHTKRAPDPSWNVGGGPFWQVMNAANGAADGLKRLKAQLAKAEKALDKQKATLDQINSSMSSLSSSVQSGLRSELFGPSSGSPWASSQGTVASTLTTLQGDITSGNQFSQLLAQLKARGLSGGALQALLQEGDPALLQQFANASDTELAQYQQLYSDRDAVLGAAGQSSAEAIYGQDQKRAEHRLEAIRDEVRALRKDVRDADKHNQKGHKDNAEDVGHWVNGAAANGYRRGHRGRR